MPIIKQISVFNGNSWDTDDIGVNAGNVDLLSADGTAASTIAGSTNLLTGLNSILPVNQLTASRALISDASGRIGTSNISTTILNTALNGASTEVSLQSQIDSLKTSNEFSFKNYNSYSKSTTIEAYLDTLPNNKTWFCTITSNDSSGAIVTASNGQHLFYIAQFAATHNNRFQLAVAVNNQKVYIRTYLWWGSWTSWTAV